MTILSETTAFARSLLSRSLLRFGMVGSSATLCYLWAGHLLVSWARWPAPAAHGLAGLLALLAAYAGHCFWTFGIRGGDHARMLPRFVLVQGAGLWLGDLFARGLGWCGVPHGLALPAASLAAPLFLYLLCRLWVFRPVRSMNLSSPSSRGTSMHHVPMSEAPVVSVIMNCLNSSEHLQETLDSLAAQTFTDFEVIFWDNGSTDSSPQIARGHAGLAGRLRYFRGEKTVPLGAARNLAIARSRGRYVAFLDCDDLWRPEKLARQVACFEADPHVGLVSTDTEIFDGKHVLKRLFAESRPQRGKAFAALMERQWISMSSAMLSRAALDSVVCPPAREGGAPVWFDESLNVCEEADIFYRVAHDWELDHVDAPLTLWRVHGNNTTFRKFGQFADETLYILEKHRRLWPGYDAAHPELVSLLTRRAAFQKAVSLWREGRGSEARAVIRPWRDGSRKYRLFWWASHLPGACFDLAARLYFALPSVIRRR